MVRGLRPLTSLMDRVSLFVRVRVRVRVCVCVCVCVCVKELFCSEHLHPILLLLDPQLFLSLFREHTTCLGS